MAEKCAICNEKIQETFLGKIIGTYIGKGKSRKAICSKCQKSGKELDKM